MESAGAENDGADVTSGKCIFRYCNFRRPLEEVRDRPTDGRTARQRGAICGLLGRVAYNSDTLSIIGWLMAIHYTTKRRATNYFHAVRTPIPVA